MIKKSIRYTLKFIGYFLVFILAYLITSLILSNITVNKDQKGLDEMSMYILTNGVHVDLVFPVKTSQIDWSQELKYEHTQAANASYRYIAMGWGDKGFYLETPTWADLKVSTALRASSGFSNTAMHTTYYKQMIENETCIKIDISIEEYLMLIEEIKNTFQKDGLGRFIPISTNANYGVSDAFYEANGSYSIFNTCNTWANETLKKGGQKACLWTPLDRSIFSKYQ